MQNEASDWVEVYRARNVPEAHAVRVMLEHEGMLVTVDNELLQGALGELPLGWVTAPRVMVAQQHAAAATDLVRGFLERLTKASEDTDREDQALACLACGTPMGDEDVCPECGWSYESDLPERNR